MREDFLLPVHGEKVAEGRMRGSAMRGGNSPKTERARILRQVENNAEGALWSDLRGRRLNGYKFVRQLPIGPYSPILPAARSCLWSKWMEANTLDGGPTVSEMSR